MPSGYLLLILHAHLPYVRHPEFDRFLEERWFFEAVTETYVPLIKFLDRLRAEGTPFKLTLSVSPTLANMMEDPLLRERCVRHFDTLVELAEREIERTRQWHDVNFLATMYRNIFEDSRRTFVERCQTRLVSAFRELAESGHLELMTCAGTHGYLPLLNSEPATVRAQVLASLHEHQRIFGSPPAGMWVPECAFYPGLDELLAAAGVRYFVVDSHAVEHADPRPLFGINAPLYCPSGVAAFGRHPTTSKLVWSNKIGYPADYNYREYYRDIGLELDQHYLEPYQYARGVRTPVGIKYHRITGPGPDKHLYNPDCARDTAERQRGTSWTAAAIRPCAPARGCRSPRCSSRPTTRSCSATGGSRARSGSIMSSANWPTAGRSLPGRRAGTWRRTRSSSAQCRRRVAGGATATVNTGSTRGPTLCGAPCTRPRPG